MATKKRVEFVIYRKVKARFLPWPGEFWSGGKRTKQAAQKELDNYDCDDDFRIVKVTYEEVG